MDCKGEALTPLWQKSPLGETSTLNRKAKLSVFSPFGRLCNQRLQDSAKLRFAFLGLFIAGRCLTPHQKLSFWTSNNP